ncbi:MAG: hypothetical protein ABIO79_02275 [Ferruginibacter sp.]
MKGFQYMDIRVEKIIGSFLENGWRMIGPIDISTDWWFDEIILIESVWNPVGKKLYLAVLTDPMEVKQKEIWGVSVSSVIPENRSGEPLGLVTLTEVKKIDLKKFVQSINNSVLQ